MWKYTFLIFVGLMALEVSFFKPIIEIFCEGLAIISHFMIQLFDDNIIFDAPNILRHKTNGFAIAVSNECSGLSAIVLLSMAILIFPASRQAKLYGIVVGFVLIEIINILRLISLVYAGVFLPNYFDMIHTQAWTIALYFITLLLFAGWLMVEKKYHAY